MSAVIGYPKVFEAAARRFAAEADQPTNSTAQASFSSAAILLAVASVEATIGEFLYRVSEGTGPIPKSDLSVVNERLVDKSGPYEQCKAIALFVRPNDDFMASSEGLDEFRCVYQLRNAIVHYSRIGLPRGEWPSEVGKRCAQVLEGQRSIAGYDWTSVALTHPIAVWASETAASFRSAWNSFVYGK